MIRALAPLLLLAGCDRGPSPEELATRDRERAEKTDPAVIDALADPILADRGLRIQDDSLRVRATPGPVQVILPPDERDIPPVARCDGPFTPAPNAVLELPSVWALPPGARVLESASRDAPGCRIRFVRLAAPQTPEALAATFEARAARAGLPVARTVREGELILSGANASLAYTLLAKPARGGSEAAIILNLAPPAP